MKSFVAMVLPRLKAQRWLIGISALYAILFGVFSTLTDTRGLITPSGSIDAGFLALGLAVLALRIIVLFFVPLVAVYRLAHWLLGRFAFSE